MSSATTLNTYSHGIDEMQQRAAVKIDLCVTRWKSNRKGKNQREDHDHFPREKVVESKDTE